MTASGGSFGGKAGVSGDDQPARGGSRRGPGGTSGGLGEFIVGVVLAGIGTYLLLERVTVHASFWRFSDGGSAFGVTLLPMLIGVAVLFFNGKSVLGWVLTVGGLGALVVGVVANMDIYFRRTSLTVTLIMLCLIAAGLGLVFKSLRPH